MLGLPKQWLAVRKYGVPSLAVLLINDPVHAANPPFTINATAFFSTCQSAPSGQFTLMLQAPLLPNGPAALLAASSSASRWSKDR